MSFPENIMIVDNEKLTQSCIKNILIQNQVKNIECYDVSDDALHSMKTKEFDMVLMDINVNGSMNGIELAKKILQIKNIPIIFISAQRDISILEDIISLSPYGYVFKPFSSTDIKYSLQLAYKNYSFQKAQYRRDELQRRKVIKINEKYTYDMEIKKLYAEGQTVQLNLKQCKVIEILCKNMDTIVSNDTLSYEIWKENKTVGSTLRTLIYRIRKTLPDLPLISHNKIGYSIQSYR